MPRNIIKEDIVLNLLLKFTLTLTENVIDELFFMTRSFWFPFTFHSSRNFKVLGCYFLTRWDYYRSLLLLSMIFASQSIFRVKKRQRRTKYHLSKQFGRLHTRSHVHVFHEFPRISQTRTWLMVMAFEIYMLKMIDINICSFVFNVLDGEQNVLILIKYTKKNKTVYLPIQNRLSNILYSLGSHTFAWVTF